MQLQEYSLIKDSDDSSGYGRLVMLFGEIMGWRMRKRESKSASGWPLLCIVRTTNQNTQLCETLTPWPIQKTDEWHTPGFCTHMMLPASWTPGCVVPDASKGYDAMISDHHSFIKNRRVRKAG